jgi:hypothetical protein
MVKKMWSVDARIEARRVAAVKGRDGCGGLSLGTVVMEAATAREAAGRGNGQGESMTGLSVKSKEGG